MKCYMESRLGYLGELQGVSSCQQLDQHIVFDQIDCYFLVKVPPNAFHCVIHVFSCWIKNCTISVIKTAMLVCDICSVSVLFLFML